jgi:diguanylate cyclase (GGDEF)-like protein
VSLAPPSSQPSTGVVSAAPRSSRWRTPLPGLPLYPALHAFVAAVTLVGIAVFTALAVSLPAGALRSPEAIGFAAFVIVAELLPVKVPRRADELTVSTTFAFALLITSGLPEAVVAQGAALIFADLWRRKSLVRCLFNVAQGTLALAAAGAAWTAIAGGQLTAGDWHFSPLGIGAYAAAALAFFVTNNLLAGTAWALAERERVLPYLVHDLVFQITSTAVLLGMGPIVVVVAGGDPLLVPLLALPLAAIYKGGRDAVVHEHRALHDNLTGLPNRALFRDRAAQAILAAERDGTCVAVMLMDLDRFKEVNDTLGHHHGDLLLTEVGPRLEEALRDTDTIARFGGDEFAVLLPDVPNAAAAGHVAAKMISVLEEPFSLYGLSIDVGASIGIACYPTHGREVGELIQHADVAMYQAKRSRSGFELYAREEDSHSPSRLALAGELRYGLEREEIELHYQPKVHLATGEVQGVEALVRWQHPRHGLLKPDDFVPLAERTGLIRPLTMSVLRVALKQAREWHAAGIPLAVAVNLSARNLQDRRLPDDIARMLKQYHVPPERLELEITETAVMTDPALALTVLRQLDAMGIKLAIDDFGTGYSSLAYLNELPISLVKIDKTFVRNLEEGTSDAAIVRSTIDLARNLGYDVVAEGVESKIVHDLLTRLGCPQAQGYFVSRPLRADYVAQWLETARRRQRSPWHDAPAA